MLLTGVNIIQSITKTGLSHLILYSVKDKTETDQKHLVECNLLNPAP